MCVHAVDTSVQPWTKNIVLHKIQLKQYVFAVVFIIIIHFCTEEGEEKGGGGEK